MTGAVHYKAWHVDPRDAQVILEGIKMEADRLKTNRQKLAEQEREAAEERAAERKRRAERRKARYAELKAAGLWTHPQYKTLKAACADGWHPRREGEVGGEQIMLKGHTFVRNTKKKRYVYRTTLGKVYGLTPAMIQGLGEPDRYCENPHWKSGPYPASLFAIERVEAWIETNKERVEKARRSHSSRSAAARHVHDKKRAERYENAKAWVKGLAINVDRPFADTLLADAQACFGFHGHQDCLLERGLHAYVRHRMTNYESLLQQLYQNEFSALLYPFLRERVDEAVRSALVEWREKAEAESDHSLPGTPANSQSRCSCDSNGMPDVYVVVEGGRHVE
jgi:hypothetical protein